MHDVTIRQEIIDRVLARRGRFHLFDKLDARRTALVAIDMQTTFCEPGAPAEVPASRNIVSSINRLSAGLRTLGVPVIWVLHANTHHDGRSDWELFFNYFIADEVRARTIDSLAPGRQTVCGRNYKLRITTSPLLKTATARSFPARPPLNASYVISALIPC
jgi:ureidoacrylate peracid hydrolase